MACLLCKKAACRGLYFCFLRSYMLPPVRRIASAKLPSSRAAAPLHN